MVGKRCWGSKTRKAGPVALKWRRMPRPSQYSRGRRVVMQLTLVLVLAATLSLAGLIARSRERALAVELTSHPIPHGGLLDVRLPKGWKWAWDSSELPVTVTAIEQLPA